MLVAGDAVAEAHADRRVGAENHTGPRIGIAVAAEIKCEVAGRLSILGPGGEFEVLRIRHVVAPHCNNVGDICTEMDTWSVRTAVSHEGTLQGAEPEERVSRAE